MGAMLMGKSRQWEPENDQVAKYWVININAGRYRNAESRGLDKTHILPPTPSGDPLYDWRSNNQP